MFKPYFFYSLLLGLAAAASLIASVWVVYNLDPEVSVTNVATFCATGGLFVLTLVALVLFFFRQRYGVREMLWHHLAISLRQGAWAALLFIAALLLQANGLLTWLNSAFLAIALMFLETFFLYRSRKASRPANGNDQETN